MSVRTKTSYQETSPDEYLQEPSSGSSSTGCPTHTGNRLPAILKPTSDWFSPTELQWKPPLDDGFLKTLHPTVLKELQDWWETKTLHHVTSGKSFARLDKINQEFWFTQFLKEKRALTNGSNGATSLDQELFWNHRREVPEKS